MKLETKIVWIAALVQFVNIVDFMMVMPLGPDISKSLPVTNGDIGVICGCYTIAVGLSGILCSKFLDRFDRKSVALVAVLGLSFGTVSATLCWNIYSLIAARVLAGIFGGPAAAIALSMVADVVPPERRGKAMAIVMGSFAVSSIGAIPFGLELARWGSWRTPFYGISILGLAVFFLILFVTPTMKDHLEYKVQGISIVQLLKKSDYLLAFIMMMTAMMSSYAIIPNISAYFQLDLGMPREDLSFLYLAGGIITLVLMQLGGSIADRIGPIPANIAGTVLLVYFLYDGFVHEPRFSLVIIFIMFMGMVCFRNVSATAEASKLPKPYERAAFMSLLSSLQHMGNGLGALIASAMVVTSQSGELLHMERVGLFSIILALFQPLILIVIRQNGKNSTASDPLIVEREG